MVPFVFTFMSVLKTYVTLQQYTGNYHCFTFYCDKTRTFNNERPRCTTYFSSGYFNNEIIIKNQMFTLTQDSFCSWLWLKIFLPGLT